MLNWSDTRYKFTFGLGCLATTAAMADLWKSVLPVWFILGVALLPFIVFVIFRPGELPSRAVRGAQVFAAAWYVLSLLALSAAFVLSRRPPSGWPLYAAFGAVGLVPCFLVFRGAARRTYALAEKNGDTDRRAK